MNTARRSLQNSIFLDMTQELHADQCWPRNRGDRYLKPCSANTGLSHKHETFHKAATQCRDPALACTPLKWHYVFLSPLKLQFFFLCFTDSEQEKWHLCHERSVPGSALAGWYNFGCLPGDLSGRQTFALQHRFAHQHQYYVRGYKLVTSSLSVLSYTCKGTKERWSSKRAEGFVLAQGCWAGTGPDLGRPAGHTVSMAGEAFWPLQGNELSQLFWNCNFQSWMSFFDTKSQQSKQKCFIQLSKLWIKQKGHCVVVLFVAKGLMSVILGVKTHN